MNLNMNSLDRRRFLRGTGLALALPLFETFATSLARASEETSQPRRLACFYFPDGVPMPLPEDPAYRNWAWFPLVVVFSLLTYVGASIAMWGAVPEPCMCASVRLWDRR